ERAYLGDDAADPPVARGLRQANQVDDRPGAIGLVVAFQPHGDLHRRAAKDTRLDVDERILERPPGWIVVVSDVAGGAFRVAGERLALRDQLGLGAVDEVSEIGVAADIDLRALLQAS